jgi:hypothetical protein
MILESILTLCIVRYSALLNLRKHIPQATTLLSHLSHRIGKEFPPRWEESPTALGKKSHGVGKEVPPPWERIPIEWDKMFA